MMDSRPTLLTKWLSLATEGTIIYLYFYLQYECFLIILGSLSDAVFGNRPALHALWLHCEKEILQLHQFLSAIKPAHKELHPLTAMMQEEINDRHRRSLVTCYHKAKTNIITS